MMALSGLLGGISLVGGFGLALWQPIPPGAAVALIASALFLAVVLFKPSLAKGLSDETLGLAGGLAGVGCALCGASRRAWAAPKTPAEWLVKILQAISPVLAERLSPEMLNALNFLVRKGAHFCGFAILAYLGYRMFRDSFGLAPPVALRWAILTSILRAFLDEWQQSFVPGAHRHPDGCGD